MMCVYCDFRCDYWDEMRTHYKQTHPYEKRPDKLYTYEARHKVKFDVEGNIR